MPAASVVIPAYNEAAVVDRCLAALRGADVHAVVVANGCHDDTAERARSHGVSVVELETASKIAALNAGDAACGELFPRIYLDADVVLRAADADKLSRFLATTPEPVVCAAAPDFDLDGASWPVRWFFRAYLQMPYVGAGMVGSGLYAVNASGRARWREFPEMQADDFFVQGLFAESERATVPDTCFLIKAPRTVRGLLNIRTRIYRGNREAVERQLAGSMASSRGNSVRSLLHEARRQPRLAGPIAAYLVLNVVAMLRARWGRRGTWLTDSSTRG